MLVGLLFLVLFEPKRLPQIARDLGRFASNAQNVVDDLKTDLMSEVEGYRKPQRGSETQEVPRDQTQNLTT